MKLSEIKQILDTATTVDFQLPNGTLVPPHFHVTEVGIITKHFIDCGGTVRFEKVANFQLWNANDTDHRLKPSKLKNIISLSEKQLGMEDLEVEVEYQSHTIGKYNIGHNGDNFLLIAKQTDCLAKDSCGQPENVAPKHVAESCCAPGSKCC